MGGTQCNSISVVSVLSQIFPNSCVFRLRKNKEFCADLVSCVFWVGTFCALTLSSSKIRYTQIELARKFVLLKTSINHISDKVIKSTVTKCYGNRVHHQLIIWTRELPNFAYFRPHLTKGYGNRVHRQSIIWNRESSNFAFFRAYSTKCYGNRVHR